MKAESEASEVVTTRSAPNAGCADLISRFRRYGQPHDLAPRQRLPWNHGADQELYVVEWGVIKLSLFTPERDELIMGLCFAGDIAGLQGFGDAPQFDAAATFEHTRVRGLPLAVVRQLCHDDRRLHRQLLWLASQRLVQLQHRMLVVARSRARERVAGFLLELENRRGPMGKTMMDVPLSRHDIGNYLCLSLETVSRSLGELEQEGIIYKRARSLRILDRERLVAMAGECVLAPDYWHDSFLCKRDIAR